MTTTDGNGIVFYEETDPVSPLHTLLNTGQQSVSDAINNLIVEDTGWTSISFDDDFSNFSGSTPCQVRRIGGVVYSRGLVRRTAGDLQASTQYSNAIIIPEGFRPADYNLYVSAGNAPGISSPITLNIKPGGGVDIRTGSSTGGAYASLGGISWLTD